jgi:ketosteroid isomerase-like protein
MSQENVELGQRAADAFSRHDLDAFLALCDPDLEFTSRHVGLEGGAAHRGHDGVRIWWDELLAIFPDVSSEIEEVRDLGDVTIARHRFRGRGIESEAPIEQTNWQVTKWRDGKAIWWSSCRSEAEALEAAELRKQPPMPEEGLEPPTRGL